MIDKTEDGALPWIEAEMPSEVEHGLDIAERARALYSLSMEADVSLETADNRARRALAVAVSALNWLEGTEFEADAHATLHEMGRDVRRRFPDTCVVTWTGDHYSHTCPARLSHKRFGFSPGLVVGRKTCSLCGEDSSECEHLTTRKYLVKGGIGPGGFCVVCGKDECVEHSAQLDYWVRPIRRIEEVIEMTELSIVHRPRQPDARLQAIRLDKTELANQFGTRFNPGEPLYCHYCLMPCEGFHYWKPSIDYGEPSRDS
jgi:hypothetical protein